MNPDSYPKIPDALIAALDEHFPERCPNPADSEREVWLKAGERRLVRKLKAVHAAQNETELEGN